MSSTSYSLCLVMPAFQRYALSEITFRQRKEMCEQLALRGVKADCVVIADDQNLDIARDNGFHTVEQDNEFLGRKFNDGHEFAAKSGYDYVCPVGSDMFLDAEIFTALTNEFTITNEYALIRSNGRSLATMHIDWGILQIIPVRMMESLDYRPCEERIAKGCDTFTRNRIKSAVGRDTLNLIRKFVHKYECVSFQSKTQITSFNRLVEATGADVIKGHPQEILDRLASVYSDDLVKAIIQYYVDGTSQLS